MKNSKSDRNTRRATGNMKNFLRRNLPVGYSAKKEGSLFALCMAGATFFSMTFFLDYDRARESLFRYVADGFRKELIPGAVMEDFADVLGYSMAAFPLMALICLAAQLFNHYAYHRNGSNAFYTMKRLPDRCEFGRRCVVLPLIEAALILLTMAAVFAAYYLIYMKATPAEALQAGQWSLVLEKWRVF